MCRSLFLVHLACVIRKDVVAYMLTCYKYIEYINCLFWLNWKVHISAGGSGKRALIFLHPLSPLCVFFRYREVITFTTSWWRGQCRGVDSEAMWASGGLLEGAIVPRAPHLVTPVIGDGRKFNFCCNSRPASAPPNFSKGITALQDPCELLVIVRGNIFCYNVVPSFD